MSFTQILAIIPLIVQFWDDVVWLVKLLQTTPEANREAIMNSIQGEADNFAKTGRPTW